MIQVRRFGPDLKVALRRTGCRGLAARMIQLPADVAAQLGPEEVSRRFDGAPIVIARPNTVVALYLDAHGTMDEHAAPEPILFVITGGRGFVRVGGPRGDTIEVAAGDAVLWPAHTLHMAWTGDEPLEAIAFHYSPEPPAQNGQVEQEDRTDGRIP